MTPNEAILHTFYTCFKRADVEGMQDCYHDDAVFNDTIFSNLSAHEVKAMWAMLIRSAKDMEVSFSDIRTEGDSGTAKWEAVYTFSATGRKVLNKIEGHFTFKDGKILRHTDSFPFYTWAKQAFGFTGLLIGWTAFFRNKVRVQAKGKLESYLNSHRAEN